jgi:formyl-CoA transferase
VRTGNRHGGLAESPYNVYPTSDGYIAIICVGETHWKSLVRAMERPDLDDDMRFATLKDRVANMDAVDAIVGSFTSRFDKQSLFEILLRNRVPCAPVRDLDEVVNDPHMHARGALHWIEHPDLGRIPVPGSPMRYQDSAARAIVASRRLGEDNRAVYTDWLGIAPAELAALQAEGVV